MYVNDLPDVLFDCCVHVYADHVQLYTSIRKENIDSCLHSIDRVLDRIESWASTKKNHSKSKCIMLSRTKVSFVIPGLSIKGNEIDFVESATNLSILFNDKLSHISVVVGRMYSML